MAVDDDVDLLFNALEGEQFFPVRLQDTVTAELGEQPGTVGEISFDPVQGYA